MRRILLVIHDLKGGGAERVFVNLANSLHKEKIVVEILLAEKTGIFLDHLNPQIQVYELGAKKMAGYLKSMFPFFRKRTYSHILSSGDSLTSSLLILKKLGVIRAKVVPALVYNLLAYLPEIPYVNRKWLLFLYRTLICRVSVATAPSQGIADSLENLELMSKSKVHIIYNPVVDDEMLAKGQEPVTEPLFNNGKQTLISIGRITSQKDHHTLVSAFDLLHKKGMQIQLIILGIGDMEKELRQYITDLGLTNDVILLGFKENPYAYLAKSDLFVLSSVFEGFGNVVAEALGMGINVVSTDCPSGPSEILEGGKCGWLCPVSNPQKLAEAIEDALANPKSADFLKASSTRFHVDTISKQYMQLLN